MFDGGGKEYEAKFLDINIEVMRKKLTSIGSTIVHPMIKYDRTAYDLFDPKKEGFARVRSEHNKVTLTAKIYNNTKFPDEYEIEAKDSYEKCLEFMKGLGFIEKAVQESYREKWTHNLAHEITFDVLPGLPTYMEIDCDSEENLNKLIDMLQLDKSKMRFGSFGLTYDEYYGITPEMINKHIPYLTFSNTINELAPKKNKDLLLKIIDEQKKLFGKAKITSPNNIRNTKPKKKSKNSKKNSKKSSKKNSKKNSKKKTKK